jgi:hypothetical protein
MTYQKDPHIGHTDNEKVPVSLTTMIKRADRKVVGEKYLNDLYSHF